MAKITKPMITSFSKFQSAWEKDAGKPENTIMYYLIAALNIEKDPKLLAKYLNDPDNKYFKTAPTKL